MNGEFRILVVCTGNLCRSPLAERIIAARLRVALGTEADRFTVTSAGTDAVAGQPMDPRAAATVTALGASPADFESRALTAGDVEDADLVLTATRAHRARAVSLYPRAHRYTFTIREFARLAGSLPEDAVDPQADPVRRTRQLVTAAAARRGAARPARPDGDDVADPLGGTGNLHEAVGAVIADALSVPLEIIGGVGFPPAAPPPQDRGTAPARARPHAWPRARPCPGAPRIRTRPVLAAGGALAMAALLGAGWLAIRGTQAQRELAAARGDLRDLRAALLSGDATGARGALADARRRTGRARELTDDPVWWAASAPPYLGNTPRAVRAVATAVDEVTRHALPRVVDVGSDLDPRRLRPAGDRVAIDHFGRIGPALDAASAALERARARLDRIERSWVPGPVTSDVRDLRRELGRTASTLDSVRRAARLVPPMLGGTRPRRYLVAFQNNAEARGTGGLLGLFAVVSADRGRLRIERLGSNTELTNASSLPVDLGEEYHARWGEDPAMWVNSNLDPHFPNAARLWLALWERQTRERLDGVIATDPVAFSHILRATGPVRLRTGDTVTADNAVALTMSTVYARFPGDNATRDAYMRSVATSVIDTLLSGRGDQRGLLAQLSRAAGERRLLVYSTDPAEERDLAATSLGGTLPRGTGPDGSGPYAYVVVNNVSGSKMDYYLQRSLRYTSRGCVEGRRRSRIEIGFGNASPPARDLPDYVTQRQDGHGGVDRRIKPGSVVLLVSVYGARHAGVTRATLDGAPLTVSSTTANGHPVWGLHVVVDRGTRRTVVLDVDEPSSNARAVVPVQPLVRPAQVTTSIARCR